MSNLNNNAAINFDNLLLNNNEPSIINTIDKTKENMVGFISIKMVAMIYVAIIQISINLVLSKLINKVIPDIEVENINKKTVQIITEENKKESTPLLLLYTFINLSLILFATYIMRNVSQRIPFPFEGVAGFQYSKLKELNGVFIASFVLLYYQNNFFNRLKIIFDKIF